MVMKVCEKCSKFVASPESLDSDKCCPICLGAGSSLFQQSLLDAIRLQAGAYTINRFSRESRFIIFPGDIVYRHKVLSGCGGESTVNFCQQLKQRCQMSLDKCLAELEEAESNSGELSLYPSCVAKEEQGFLGVHVILQPSKGCYRPREATSIVKRRTERTRPRGQQCTEPSQGGDPKLNHEVRLNECGVQVWTQKQALELLEEIYCNGQTEQLVSELPSHILALDIHVAIWRLPFYLRSMYTKTQRDISQTPFHVVEQDGKRRKLGRTSVEEEICPAVVRACGGIGEENNDNKTKHLKVYGMAKFHASGREDMDVRMLLPETNEGSITGRPFVLQIYDAHRLPTMDSLKTIVSDINGGEPGLSLDGRSYGRNPTGVGISPELMFASSESFKQLQSETESKVKHYGCLCWSKNPLPLTDEELDESLGSFPLELAQSTPIRVLHRRANSVRNRHVLKCKARRIDEHYFRLILSTTAGTYVKEFVHSDLGRTVPSISSLLGCTTDILELDCEGIEM